jgi:hypothetical protein
MGKKYQTHFEMNPNDIELVENALRAQASALSQDLIHDENRQPSLDSLRKDERHTKVVEIQHLLAKLHDRKVWYAPQNRLPRG